MNTKEKIIEYIQVNGATTPSDLVRALSVSRALVFRHLLSLIKERKLVKTGKPPVVYYTIATQDQIYRPSLNTSEEIKDILEKNFIQITPDGRFLKGVEAFIYWCSKRNLDSEVMSQRYFEIFNKYKKRDQNQIFSVKSKLQDSLGQVFLNECFFEDVYSYEIFGKTRLGQLVLYAKQSQDVELIKKIAIEIKQTLLEIIKKYNIEAIGFIPHTINRKLQFINELAKILDLGLPEIKIDKILTEVVVPQKTLSSLEDRKLNAERTFVVRDVNYKRILIIDDALGSGATLNEIAKKVMFKNPGVEVIGFAIVSSAKGFDVINEV